MTEQRDDGGPAFPLQSIGPDFAPGYAGMALRDFLATQALPVVLERELGNRGMFRHVCDDAARKVAHEAYLIADAMLKARNA